ncbi:MAG: hypothetical protein HY216_14425 [Candidatus Rokubacteria bacterium]|nr:hypothetical protein [Candidatus Rokubacteria bacterium]
MEWLMTIVTALGLAVMFAPLVTLFLAVFVLMPLGLLAPRAPTSLARTSFRCPFREANVMATFCAAPGFIHPTDVIACSAFGAGAVTCKKGCLALAEAREGPSLMAARYALLSGAEALRDPLPLSTAPAH